MIKHHEQIFAKRQDDTTMSSSLTLELPGPAAVPEERSPTLVRPNLTIHIPDKEMAPKKTVVAATPLSMGRGHSVEDWQVRLWVHTLAIVNDDLLLVTQVLEQLVLGCSGEWLCLDFQMTDLPSKSVQCYIHPKLCSIQHSKYM